MTPAALRAIADAADALARLAREASVEERTDPTVMVPLAEAARVAGTSIRVVRDAIRGGVLPGYGRQRDRSVRRADLDAWILSRRMKPLPGIDDRDIEARIERLAGLRPNGKAHVSRSGTSGPR
jgi:hypothetical protein